ncbi:hypothetical protein NDU88_003999 [Pleurodeles waltl]|uniref:Uncharacterized protein n=1 Tax=Pleurodeles waltl TaxID=8319 RepID=A0AAV7M5P2_PLEWA|nr:hypothetical protein NDU88_003999 [Pleurodeles waltl]
MEEAETTRGGSLGHRDIRVTNGEGPLAKEGVDTGDTEKKKVKPPKDSNPKSSDKPPKAASAPKTMLTKGPKEPNGSPTKGYRKKRTFKTELDTLVHRGGQAKSKALSTAAGSSSLVRDVTAAGSKPNSERI